MQFTITKIEEWENVVEEIIPRLEHNILLLKGNLGAGKTTFTQHLVRKLGSKDEVTSPTYAIVNNYHSPKGDIFHFDLYRLKNENEVFDIGMDEYLESGFLNIIEWPEIFMDELADFNYHEMTIENTGNKRTIIFK